MLFVNLVFDNIDFKEESNKQTHVTNGIIIQKVEVCAPNARVLSSQQPAISKSQRSILPPPSTIPPYFLGAKKTPTFNCNFLNTEAMRQVKEINEDKLAGKLDLIYAVIKIFADPEEQLWPGWTGFNTMLKNNDVPDVSRVGYLPIVNGPSTEYSTLHEVLQTGIRIMDALQLQQTAVVFDEAVYAKIQHIRWKEEIFYKRFVARLGEFHTCMSFLSAISKLFEDGGLKVWALLEILLMFEILINHIKIIWFY